MKMKKARLALYITLACLLVASALGTAYAKYTSEPLEETFNVYVTAGTVDLRVSDDKEVLLVPGTYLQLEQPFVYLNRNSEDCYVFIKIEMSENAKDILTIGAVSNVCWTPLEGHDNVYLMDVTKAANQAEEKKDPDNSSYSRYAVFGNVSQAVYVKPSATRAQIAAAAGGNITITAYAVQKTHGIETPADAWSKLLAN